MKIKIEMLNTSERSGWQLLYYAYPDFYEVPMNILILESVWVFIFEEDEAFYALMAKNEEKELISLIDYREMTSPFGGKK